MNLSELTKNTHYEILKEDTLSFSLEVLNTSILYQTIVQVSIFEKYIIQVIDKAFTHHISLINIVRGEAIVDFQKISNILLLDNEIIENTINSLASAGLIEIQNKILKVKWNKNLENWEKEVLIEEQKDLFFKDKEAINSFNNLSIEDKDDFLFNQYSNDKKIFYHCEVNSQNSKEITINSFIILDKKSFEIKIAFEKDNQLLTLTNNFDTLQTLCNEELIIL